jgi:hypothetical protein
MSYTIPQIPVTALSPLIDDFVELGGVSGGSRKILASSFVLTTDPRLSALGTVTSVSANGGATGLSFTGSPITETGTLQLGGALVPASGGTGNTTYAIGDLIQASSSTALTRLAAVAAGNVLLSGGVNTISSWGKVGIGSHVSGLGTGVAAALAVAVGNAGAPVVFGGALGTPASGMATNLSGTASGLTAGTVTTNANLTGDVLSVGNATSIASGVIVNDDINLSAAIADSKLATISSSGKVSNSATTATSVNVINAIVARNVDGDFSARVINGTSGVFTALSAVNSVRVTGAATIDGPSSALDYISGKARVWSWGPDASTLGTFAVRLARSNGSNASEPLTVTSTGTAILGTLSASGQISGNLTGDVTGIASDVANGAVIAKVLTGYVSGAGVVAATDSILGAIQKLNGNDASVASAAATDATTKANAAQAAAIAAAATDATTKANAAQAAAIAAAATDATTKANAAQAAAIAAAATDATTKANAAQAAAIAAAATDATTKANAAQAAAIAASQPLDTALSALAGGSDFVKFSGPTGSIKTFTLPDANAELVYQGGNATLSVAAITQLKLAPELGYATAGDITFNFSFSRSRIVLTGNLRVLATGTRANDASGVLELYNPTANSLTLTWSLLASWKTNGVLPTTIPPGQTFQFLFQCWGTAETDVSINYINPAGSGVFNASNYGLVAGNTASQNVTALQAAVTAAVAATRGTVVIPQGQWDFNAAITLGANPNCQLAIRGEGKGVTVLRLSSTTAEALFDFNFITGVGDQRFNFATFSDFTIKPSAPNVKRLIRIKNSMGSFHEAPGCEFYRIAFQGDFTNYANISLENDGCWNTVIRNCLFVGQTNGFVGTVNGTGNAIVVNSDNAFSVNGLVSECQFAFMSRAFYCGGLDANGYPDDTAGAVGVRCEGWTLRDCIAVGLQKGVTFLNGDSTQIPWFNVNNFEMETYLLGWSFRIFNVANVNISDCLLINDENDAFLKYHFYLDRVSFSDIYDNQLKNRPHFAFYLTDNCGIVKIHDNVIDRVATTGFFLGPATSNCQIRNNIFVTAPPTYLDDSGTTNSVDCQGSITWDPGSLIPGQQDNTTLTVSGVKFGATISLGVPYDLNGLTATANVHSPNVVRITLYNSTGGTIDPGSGTWRVRAINPGP